MSVYEVRNCPRLTMFLPLLTASQADSLSLLIIYSSLAACWRLFPATAAPSPTFMWGSKFHLLMMGGTWALAQARGVANPPCV